MYTRHIVSCSRLIARRSQSIRRRLHHRNGTFFGTWTYQPVFTHHDGNVPGTTFLVAVLVAATTTILPTPAQAQTPFNSYVTFSVGASAIGSKDLWDIPAQLAGTFDPGGFLIGTDTVSMSRRTGSGIALGASLTHRFSNHISARIRGGFHSVSQTTACSVRSRFSSDPPPTSADSVCTRFAGSSSTGSASVDLSVLTHTTMGRFRPYLLFGFGGGQSVGLEETSFAKLDGAYQVLGAATSNGIHLNYVLGIGFLAAVSSQDAIQFQVRQVFEQADVPSGPGNLLGQANAVESQRGRTEVSIGLVIDLDRKHRRRY